MLNKVTSFFKKRWSRENGYKQVLVIAFPLILSTGSWSIQQFVDRMYLSWYSPDALAAAVPTGLLSFTIVSFFLGTSGYANTFVAQYIGAGRSERVGPAMWQGIYIAIIGGLVVASTIFIADLIFDFVGHDPAVKALEKEYWKYLAIGGFFPIGKAAVSSFFNGRGKTYPVLWASLVGMSINVVLNYILIFGKLGLPEMGIGGAGLATIISELCSFIMLLYMALSGNNNAKFKTISGYRFDKLLFFRLIKFGIPNGIQFSLDILAFSIFILLIGRLGTPELAASNIALNISMLSFMPMIGMGITVSILVGQSLGGNRPDMAKRATFSALQMASLYMGSIAFLYVIVPQLFIYPFSAQADLVEFQEIKILAITVLKFLAAWTLLDSVAIVISSALKGAGDTRFIMFAMLGISITFLILPTYIALEVFDLGLTAAWSAGLAYMISLAVAYGLRYKMGKWTSMKVIEQPSSLIEG